MIKKDFGAANGYFDGAGSSADLTDAQLCAFDFSRSSIGRKVTHLIPSFTVIDDTGFCGTSRVIIFQGGNAPLGEIARHTDKTDLESRFGITVLLDVIGSNDVIDVSSNPIDILPGIRTAILHMPPYSIPAGVYINSMLALTVLGFQTGPGERERIYPHPYDLR